MGHRDPVFIVGGARSGTTFLAKLIDSHPEVLYRHEPDSVLVNTEIPFVPRREELPRLIDAARDYLDALCSVRATKVSGQPPFFDKAYRSPIQKQCFLSGVFLAKVAERLGGAMLKRSLPVRDWIGRVEDKNIVYLLKSVDSPWRTLLFSKAKPNFRFIHIVRHPCAVVNSRLRGIERKLMDSTTYLRPPFEAGMAEGYPFSLNELEASSYEEKSAFLWMICNQRIHDDMAGREGYFMLFYEDLCREPEPTLRRLFDFVGLSWNAQTESFIRQLEAQEAGSSGYFNIMRSPRIAMDKWRKQLTVEQIGRIERVVRHAEIGLHYFDGE